MIKSSSRPAACSEIDVFGLIIVLVALKLPLSSICVGKTAENWASSASLLSIAQSVGRSTVFLSFFLSLRACETYSCKASRSILIITAKWVGLGWFGFPPHRPRVKITSSRNEKPKFCCTQEGEKETPSCSRRWADPISFRASSVRSFGRWGEREEALGSNCNSRSVSTIR